MLKNAFITALAVLLPSLGHAWFGTRQSWPQGTTTTSFSEMGRSVAGAGDVNADGFDDVVVGMPARRSSYLYLGSASGLGDAALWPEAVNAGSLFYGACVASAGDVNNDGYSDVIIGDANGGGLSGTARLYLGSPSGLAAAEAWPEGYGPSVGSGFGRSVGSAGDVNNDGYDDVLVGSSQGFGKAYLFLGSATGLGAASAWAGDTGLAAGDDFSAWVASAGDVNGDSYGDVIVGAPGVGTTGQAYFYLGSAGGLGSAEAWPEGVGTVSGNFGSNAGAAGDVNNDGYGDVLVTAPSANSGIGLAKLYLGSAAGLGAATAWPAGAGIVANEAYGRDFAAVGDRNADGFDDVVVGASGFNSSRGIVRLYLGSASGLGAEGNWSSSGAMDAQYFGYSLDSAGDITNDGYSDLIVGAWGHGGAGDAVHGAAYVFHGILQPTPTPTRSGTRTQSPTRTASQTVSPTQTLTPSVTPTDSRTESATATSSATATPSATEPATATETVTATESATGSPTATPSASPSVSPSASPSATPSASPSDSPTPAPSPSPTETETYHESPTPSVSPSATATPTASATLSATPSATPSGTQTPSPSDTPTMTATGTPSESATATPSGTETPLASATASATVSHTFTVSLTDSPSASPTATATASPSGSPSQTSSATATFTASPAETATVTPSASATATATATAGALLSPTRTPISDPGGALAVLESRPMPHPLTAGPFQLGLLLQGGAEWLEMVYYTPAYVRIKSERVQGPFPAGWSYARLDDRDLPRGLIFYVATVGRGPTRSEGFRGRLYRLP